MTSVNAILKDTVSSSWKDSHSQLPLQGGPHCCQPRAADLQEPHIQTCWMCYRFRHWFFMFNLLLRLFFVDSIKPLLRMCWATAVDPALLHSAAVIALSDWLCISKCAALGPYISAVALCWVMYELPVPSRCSQQTLIYRLLLRLEFPFSLSWCFLPQEKKKQKKNKTKYPRLDGELPLFVSY